MQTTTEKRRFFSGIGKKAAQLAGIELVDKQKPINEPNTLSVNTTTPESAINVEQASLQVSPVAEPRLQAEIENPSINPADEIQSLPQKENEAVSSVSTNTLPSPEITEDNTFEAVKHAPTIATVEKNNNSVQTLEEKPTSEASTTESLLVNSSNDNIGKADNLEKLPENSLIDIQEEQTNAQHNLGQDNSDAPLNSTVQVPQAENNLPSDDYQVAEDDKIEVRNEAQDKTKVNEFNVKINPIAEELIKNNSGKYIKEKDGKLYLDEDEFDAAIFAKEVLQNPTVENLFNKLQERGVTFKTAMEAIKDRLK